MVSQRVRHDGSYLAHTTKIQGLCCLMGFSLVVVSGLLVQVASLVEECRL